MSLDHGILNLPLAKRGNVDAQIDAYKARQEASAEAKRKAAVAASRALKADAKQALAELLAAPALLQAKADKAGMTRTALIVTLKDWANYSPKKVIKAKADWMAA
jgi:hypothetical protein